MRAAEDSVLVVARRRYLRDLGLPIIFGAAVLFVSATLLLGVNISALQNNLTLLQHCQDVLRNVTVLETAIMGDEMTVRGYALTGDKRFLRYQDSEHDKAVQAMRELDRLTASESEHAKLTGQIHNDVVRHLAIFKELKGSGAALVAKAAIDPNIRATTARARHGLDVLRSQEQDKLAERQREMTAQISRAYFLSIGIILAAVLLGGFGLLASQLPISLRR